MALRKSVILPFTVLILVSLASQASALTMSVTGGYKEEPVTVTLDRQAFVIFRMNNGTPVYAYGNQVKFIPHVTGSLYIEVRADGEVVSKEIQITERQTSTSGSGSTSSNIYYSRTVYLPSGTFTLTASTGKTYTINWRTALGALKAASEQKGFSFTIKETGWGPFVSCIAGKCEGSDGAMSGWMYQVNGKTPMVGAHEYSVKDGDEVVWYFSRSMSETPDTSPMILKIKVKFQAASGGSSQTASESEEGQPESVRKELLLSKEITTVPGKKEKIELSEDVVSELSLLSLEVKAEKNTVKIELAKAREPAPVHGKVLKAFELEVSGAEEVKIEFRVNKNVDKDSVVLMKYNGRWIELPTEFVREDENYQYFTATISNFSTFAIVAKWKGFPLNVTDEPVVKALAWLKTIQNDDGGFANPGEESSISKTSWAIMALAASRQDPHKWVKNGSSPVDYLKNNLNSSLGKMGTADIARTILAVLAANENPRNFSGVDLVAMLKEKVKEEGQIGDFIYTTIWGIMALKAAGENVSESVEWLKAQQNEDGGFAWAVGEKSDYDDTAAAIQALIAAGEPRDSDVIKKALDYLKTGQNEDGGFKYFGNSSSNAASDAWIIQALVAAGENPREWRKGNVSVVDHLLSLQTEEGYFKYTSIQTSNPGYMTVCAIMALLGEPHPIKPEYLQGEVKLTNLTNLTGLAVSQPTATPTATPAPETTPTPLPTSTPVPTPTPAMTEEAVTTPSETKGVPGFELVIALLGLAAAVRWRR